MNNDNSRNEEWRVQLRKSKTAKERCATSRVVMPMLDAKQRIHTNDEVNQGISEQAAVLEASRCLDCANPQCVTGCPVGISIPEFIKNVERRDFAQAADVIGRTSSLPAVCGRVCPQEKQCESKCIHLKMKQQAVAIGYLERFVADWQRANVHVKPSPVNSNGIKVAVVGSGPSGLAFASDMAKQGFEVTVFEALHEVGGVLKYGIPEFRLPNSIVDHEIDGLRQLGVKFVTNVIIGKTLSYADLCQMGFKGLFVGSGAGFPRFMNITGENLVGVMSSNEYLTRINLMHAGRGGDTPVPHGDVIAVIGGGNTAIDSSRTALRMGAKRVVLVYRRSEAEMPARHEEVAHAKEEGVEFLPLHNPIEYTGDEAGHVRGMKLQRMQLGEPDASGRRRPEPIPGAVDDVPVDLVIVAVGVQPNQIVPRSIPGLDLSARGTIVVDDATMKSSIGDVYAGGDIVRGGATVILAMGDGRRAAASMSRRLMQQ